MDIKDASIESLKRLHKVRDRLSYVRFKELAGLFEEKKSVADILLQFDAILNRMGAYGYQTTASLGYESLIQVIDDMELKSKKVILRRN